jgi:hypothetical protein
MASIFTHLAKHRPAAPTPEEKAKVDPAQRMLDFILRWKNPSISTTDLMIYGPKPRQNAEETLRLATLLEKHGWLSPKSTPRKDMHHWNIIRQHSSVRPKLTLAD